MRPPPDRRARLLPFDAALCLACAPADPAGRESEAAGEPARPREVRTVRAVERGFVRALHATGGLVPFEETTLAAKVPGRIERILVDLGGRVERGQLLAQIEARDYELRVARAEAALAGARAALGLGPEDEDRVDPETTAAVRAAQAELDDARRERKRLIDLSGRGVSAPADLDRAEARVQRAESGRQAALEGVAAALALVAQRRAELATARQELSDTRILAPFDGAVGQRSVGTGSYLSTGDAIVAVVRDDPLRLRLRVGERDAAQVRAGQRLEVEIDGAPHPLEGRIARIAPAIDRRDRTLLVEAEVGNPEGGWRAGSFARARIVVDPDEHALAVPESAIVGFAGIDRVIVVEHGKAVEKRVKLGRRAEGMVELLEGLVGGEEVVLDPGNLQQGAPVVVAP